MAVFFHAKLANKSVHEIPQVERGIEVVAKLVISAVGTGHRPRPNEQPPQTILWFYLHRAIY